MYLIAVALRGVTDAVEYLDFKFVERARPEGKAVMDTRGVWR